MILDGVFGGLISISCFTIALSLLFFYIWRRGVGRHWEKVVEVYLGGCWKSNLEGVSHGM